MRLVDNTTQGTTPVGVRISFYIDRYVAENDILMVPSTTAWTNEEVTVTVSLGEDLTPVSLTCTGTSGTDYTINGTTSVVVKTNNQTVKAIATDANGNTVTRTLTISNIDKVAPTVSLGTNGGKYIISTDETNITIETTITANDEGGSNLKTLQYAWSTSNTDEPSSGWKTFTNGATVSKTDCTEGSYYLWTKVIDGAGNRAEEVKISNEFVVKQPGVYASIYQKDGEYHLIFNSDGTIADGYTQDQLIGVSGDIIDGTMAQYNQGVGRPTNMQYQFWMQCGASVKKVKIEEKISPRSTAYYFAALMNATEIEGLELIDTSNVTSMEGMFWYSPRLQTLDLSSFNTENVTNMYLMFSMCSALTELNISSFDTGNVINMQAMFNSCSSLTNLDVSNFNTSNVTNMTGMFSGCGNLTELDVSNFNTSNVTNMSNMFSNCASLAELNLSNFNTSNVTNMQTMFSGCGNLTELDVSNFNTSNVTNMSNMFINCKALIILDLSSFNTANVTNMLNMFNNCTNLTTIYVSDEWTISGVTNTNKAMFTGCTSLVGAVAFDSSKKTETMANYQTGYLTHISNKTQTPLITTATDYQASSKLFVDELGNEIIVPGGFKARPDLATLAEEGIVIEDEIGNQFVWVPIGDVKLDGGSTTTIDLGRYSFDMSSGEATLVDNAQTVLSTGTYADIADHYSTPVTETATNSNYPSSDENLQEWLENAISNKGYYISRYEVGTTEIESQEMYVSMEGVPNKLGDSVVAKYGATAVSAGNSYVESRLANSFAWDTALVFIQQVEDSSYSSNYPIDLAEGITGNSDDVACNIYEMTTNVAEWTTEHSEEVNVVRGGGFTYDWSSVPLSGGNRLALTGLDSYVNQNNVVTPGIGFRATLLVESPSTRETVVWDGTVATSFASGTGTEADPYIIETPSQLAYVNDHCYSNPGSYYKLVNDLDLANEEWEPIGGFEGNFNGNNCKIKNLVCESEMAGLFSSTTNACIDGLTIESGSLTAPTNASFSYVGGIVGYAESTVISNCENYATVYAKGEDSNAGGIVGYLDGYNSSVENVRNYGAINSMCARRRDCRDGYNR